MNSLSWYIYLIGVVDEVRGTAMIFIVAISIALSCLAIPYFLMSVVDNEEPEVEKIRRYFKPLCSALALCILVVVFLPSRQTMLMIAGSEIGQRSGAFDVVDPGIKLLKAWIENETANIGKEKK